MNKYYFHERYSVKVQKQRCHLIEVNMSTVAILVPSLVFFFFLFVLFSISLHFLLLRPLVHLQTLMRLYSAKKKKKWDASENRLVSECVVRSPFFSCAFFSLTMSLFDMPVVHVVSYWCSSERNCARDLRCLDTPSSNASDFLFF